MKTVEIVNSMLSSLLLIHVRSTPNNLLVERQGK